MSWLTLEQAASMLRTHVSGSDCEFEGISIDSRADTKNSLFFALKGPNFDAHDVLDEQRHLPISGMVVSRPVLHSGAFILVEDTRLALGQFAAALRRNFDGTVIGLTGSNGKTTVKQMLSKIFSRVGSTLATEGNLNNDIGVPLTLSGLRSKHEFAVVEMGANHAGEIDYLTFITQPDIALVTNAGAAHLEGFGTLEGVAKAKGEIFAGMSDSGIAVINADDVYADYWQSLNQNRRTITFGVSESADVRVLESNPLRLLIHGSDCAIPLKLLGRHNALNAAAAAAVAVAANVPLSDIRQALSEVQPVSGRLEMRQGFAGSVVIDDSYNANPDSVAAAIQVLAERNGERILVLGGLAELGQDAAEQYAQIGRLAQDAGIDALYSLGDQAQISSQSFGVNGAHFVDAKCLISELKNRLDENVTVLIKGSRVSRMDRVVTALEWNKNAYSEGDTA